MMGESDVFTIGHSTHAIENFIELLSQHKVTAVADVRSVPFSRFQPQFNQNLLKQILKDNHIAYVFLGKELGARSEDNTCYEKGRVSYRRLAGTRAFQSGLDRVRAGSREHRIALMCAEREPLECHRALLVSRELVAAGIKITHIHADGRLETHADAINRLLRLVKLPDSDLFRSPLELIEEAYEKQEQRVAYAEESRENERVEGRS